jgi:hypothetical protein
LFELFPAEDLGSREEFIAKTVTTIVLDLSPEQLENIEESVPIAFQAKLDDDASINDAIGILFSR